MTYFSEAQLPRSIKRQRSLQKGILGSSKATSFLQMGQRTVAVIRVPNCSAFIIAFYSCGTGWAVEEPSGGAAGPLPCVL